MKVVQLFVSNIIYTRDYTLRLESSRDTTGKGDPPRPILVFKEIGKKIKGCIFFSGQFSWDGGSAHPSIK